MIKGNIGSISAPDFEVKGPSGGTIVTGPDTAFWRDGAEATFDDFVVGDFVKSDGAFPAEIVTGLSV